MKLNFRNRSLSVVLALSMTTAMGIPAYASGNAKYKAVDETMHTIRWAEGIAEPVMAAVTDSARTADKERFQKFCFIGSPSIARVRPGGL